MPGLAGNAEQDDVAPARILHLPGILDQPPLQLGSSILLPEPVCIVGDIVAHEGERPLHQGETSEPPDIFLPDQILGRHAITMKSSRDGSA